MSTWAGGSRRGIWASSRFTSPSSPSSSPDRSSDRPDFCPGFSRRKGGIGIGFNPDCAYNGAALFLATFFFAFQVYCDFSGYSDIAIGAARVMGYELTINFRQPFFARSIRELWERRHVTLTTWFRDYIYIPMGGSRVRTFFQYRNLFVTFLISGLWHGANWTFVGWGALNGVYLVIARLTSKPRRRLIETFHLDRVNILLNPLRTVYIFILFLTGLVFFRSPSVSDAFRIFPRIATDLFRIPSLGSLPAPYDVTRDMYFLFGLIVLLNLYDWYINREWTFLEGPIARTLVTSFQFWAIMVFGVFHNQEFVYFQF
ncbi:MAG: MBOAT family protein [Candidatus Eisenbacteria bacterium]|nr:MBOAT family protein [Candidatus Eisenbacteria bacterium]